ncbi:hypothetical protein [Prauserella endophytica]|uniref:hypothetical protein n=1 Tax=Prauserella endophytica TaxID=1592324 RepID=UPI0026C9F340
MPQPGQLGRLRRRRPGSGLGLNAAHFLCERRVAAVATDTWGMEAKQYETPDVLGPLRIVLLVNAGVLIGEMWDMEQLADDCADDGTYEFFVTAPPLVPSGPPPGALADQGQHCGH